MGTTASSSLSSKSGRAETIQALLDAARVDKSTVPTPNDLPRSTRVDGRFIHKSSDFPDWPGQLSFIKWQRTKEKVPVPTSAELEQLPVRIPDLEALQNPPVGRKMQATWLGHASVLTQFDGWNVLADPIFSKRCSPVSFAGPARIRPSPINLVSSLPSLPDIDAVVISHNHYDHLDKPTVVALAARQQTDNSDIMWFVPLGMKAWLGSCGVQNVVEMDWSESAVLADFTDRGRPDLTITCLPCQHWCSRTPFDRNQCLWAAWHARTDNASFFFGGDTGYCGSMFKRIFNKLGPVSFAALPIGAYGARNERWFHKPCHMNPEEAVQTHRDLHAHKSLGIHWGTFQLTSEPILEPRWRLEAAKHAQGLGKGEFITLGHGETKCWDI